MCEICDSFSEKIKIEYPYELWNIVKKIKELIEKKIIKQKKGKIELIMEDKKWKGDIIDHIFICTNCGRKFKLYVETYHGRGGYWEVI